MLSYVETGLAPGARHRYTVAAVDNAGQRSAPASVVLNLHGGTTGPSAPGELRGSVYSETAAEIFWSRSTRFGLRYEVRRNGAALAVSNGTSYFDDGLAAGGRYRYEVVTIDPDGRRSVPSSVTLTTPGAASGGPTVPTNLRTAVYSATAAEVFWARPGTFGLRYEVRRNGVMLVTTDGTSYFDDALEGDTDYHYEIVAIDRQGRRASPSTVALTTPDGTSGGGGGSSGGHATLNLDNHMTVLRDVIRVVNEQPFERVLDAEPLLDTSEVPLVSQTESVPANTVPSRPESLAAGELFTSPLSEPITRDEYNCVEGGSIDAYTGAYPSGQIRLHADCTVDGIAVNGKSFKESGPGRPFTGVVAVADLSAASIDGSAVRTLESGRFDKARLSFVTDSARRDTRDVNYQETVSGDSTRVDDFSSTINYQAPSGTIGGGTQNAGVLPDGTDVTLYLQQTSTSLDSTFGITAPWSAGTEARVTVNLGYEDRYWYFDGWYEGVTAEALGLTDPVGAPLSLDFARDPFFYWKSIAFTVEAADGSTLELVSRDATTYTVRVDNREIVLDRNEPGLAINCAPLGPRDEIADCSLRDQTLFVTPSEL